MTITGRGDRYPLQKKRDPRFPPNAPAVPLSTAGQGVHCQAIAMKPPAPVMSDVCAGHGLKEKLSPKLRAAELLY